MWTNRTSLPREPDELFRNVRFSIGEFRCLTSFRATINVRHLRFEAETVCALFQGGSLYDSRWIGEGLNLLDNGSRGMARSLASV